MKTVIKYNKKNYTINLSEPLDISIPVIGGNNNVNSWYLPPPEIRPHSEGEFVGKVSKGGSTNFNDIFFNPHSHGTHTECIGHITEDFHSVNQSLDKYFFMAEVITVAPEKTGDDFVISKKQLQYALGNKNREAVIIRTLPNLADKKSRQYSHTNPPYLLREAAEFLADRGVEHLLVDLPSVDKEKDDGALQAHKAFWNYEGKRRLKATITELIFVANTILDGKYFLNLHLAAFENDASPSRPVLYKIEN